VLYRVHAGVLRKFETPSKRVRRGSTCRRRVLRFGTWVGGDMDGNPNVGAGTITATLAAQRAPSWPAT
jgi:phosphoenolpyruvate carboxylase